MGKEEFAFTREFNVSRELMFKVWTEPEHLKRWWGPKGFKMISTKVDLRPGGEFFYGMLSPNGDEMWGKFVYKEIIPPEKLVVIVSFSDKDGNTMRHPMSDSWPLEVLNTMTLTEKDGKTTIHSWAKPYNASEAENKTFEDGHKSMEGGYKGTLDQLEEYLNSIK